MIAPSKLTRCSLLSAFWKAAGSLGVVLSLVVATPIVAAGTPAVESTDATAWPQDRDFLTARAAFERRDLKALQEINQRLKASASAHPLTPYVRAWWLSANLAQSASFAITQNEDFVTFLAANPDTPYADNLRKEWLRLLGQQAAWELFTLGLNKAALEDPEIACHHWRLRLSQGDQTVYSEARTAWNAARSAPEACYTVFENLVTAKPLTPDEGWQRLRKLLAAGLLNDARRSAALIKGAPVNFERNTAIINLDAVRYLEREKLDRRSPASIELFLFAITRAARSDARRAAGLLTKRGDALPPQDLAYAWNQIGLYAAMQHDPDALTWFAQGASTTKAIPLTDNQAAWKIRAALRAADWQTVRQTIRALPSSEQRDPAWRYWLARALDESDKTTANSLRSGLAQEPHFYGLLAAEELGTSRAPNWQ
ncbi:MAG: hypothetical protein JNM52_10620, partial [Betaproteobacteria bacterium]|nr:hypothetical protein [Betaproteobacteria bacterium]